MITEKSSLYRAYRFANARSSLDFGPCATVGSSLPERTS
jgi:hypothetical protein